MDFLFSKTKMFTEFEKWPPSNEHLRSSSYPFFVVDKELKIQYMNLWS